MKRIITSHLKSLNPPPKKTTTYDLESKVLAWDMHKDVAGLNHLMGSQPKV
jgi:hypothetical protein